MPFTITMPKLSPTMEEGHIVKWHKKEGDFIEIDDLLIEVSTDKATVEYNASDAGYLRQIVIKEGEAAAVNEPIAVCSEEENESIEGYLKKEPEPQKEEEKKADPVAEKPQPKKETFAKASFAPAPPLEQYDFPFVREKSAGHTLASPLAKRLAKEQGIDLSSVKGSGPQGRIMSRDLDMGQATGFMSRHRNEIPSTPPGSYEEESLSPIRKVIAQRLQEAKTFVPHFYVRTEIDAEPLVSTREQLKNGGYKVTYNDFIIKACAHTLRLHPEVNSGFNSQNNTLVRFKTIDISVAVSIEEGLITPIIRHTDFKSLEEISKESKYLSNKAKEGKLEPHEFQGGSFTVSNMGMFDVTDFQAIINPPQAAILSVGAIKEQPVIKKGQVVPGKTLSLVLSVDHRVVDGVAAAKFLQDLKKILENPILMI